MEQFEQIQERLIAFRREKRWKKFHWLRNQVLALCEEAVEVRDAEDKLRLGIGEEIQVLYEIADMFIWILYIAYDQKFEPCLIEEEFDETLLSFGLQLTELRKELFEMYKMKIFPWVSKEEKGQTIELINQISVLIMSYMNYLGEDFDQILLAKVDEMTNKYRDERFTGNATRYDAND